jgi:hypothetical protein
MQSQRHKLPRTLALLLILPMLFGGCSRFRPKRASESAYVLSKQTFLRDRVAAVSNRVALVQNGQHLIVLERGRRFLKVKTDKGEIGWIEERAVVDPKVVDGFDDLAKAHAKDPVVATAVLRDDLYMHLQPGRDTDRYYLLPENDKLQLLVRASVPKAEAPGVLPAARPKPKPASSATLKPGSQPTAPAATTQPAASQKTAAPKAEDAGAKSASTPAPPADPAVPPALEDWWLVRDAQGRVGWLLARRMDVDVAEEIAGYAEGQKIVGAYVLTTVFDSESSIPNHQVPVYVAVLNAYKDGLPYDFDQVRVFTWNLKKHRYETAYRQRNLQGYLPVTVSRQTLDNAGPVPTFQFKQAVGDAVAADPQTGAMHPAQMETELYRLDGVLVKKVGPSTKPARASAASATAGQDRKRVARRPRSHHAAKHKRKS